jgi:hypothetical protein
MKINCKLPRGLTRPGNIDTCRPVKSLLLAVLLASPLSAAVVYSGEQNLSVAWNDLEGIYVNIATGATVNTWPADFEDAPWINITLGGYGIFNSELIEPWAASAGGTYDPEQTTDYYLNLAAGTVLDGSVAFMENAWASQFHIGSSGDPGKFVEGESGLLGFQFRSEAGGDIHYGWLRITPDGDGSGVLVDWAFNDTPGGSIGAGVVPEPSGAVLLTAAFGLLATRRRRV